MARAEAVDMRQDRLDARSARRKTSPTQQRVQPDQAAARQVQTVGFPREKRGVVAIKAIGNQEDHRPLPQDPARPVAIEGVQGLADAGAAGPVLRLSPCGLERGVDIPGAQVAGDVGQPCAKVKACTLAQPWPLRLATAWTKCSTMRE
jgi:hypothetical protein